VAEKLWTDDEDPSIAALEQSLTSLGSSFLIHCQRDLHGILELPRLDANLLRETYHTSKLIKAPEAPWYRSQRLMNELRPYGSKHVPSERYEDLADAVTEKWLTEGRLKDRASQHAVSTYLVGQMQTNNTPAKSLEPKLEYPRAQMGAYITALTDRTRSAIQTTLNQAVMSNSSPGELANTLFSRFGALNRDWRRIAITETSRNRSDGHLSALIGQTATWHASKDACPHCRAMHGKSFTVDHGDPSSHVYPGKTYVPDGYTLESWVVIPGHPNCRCRWVGLVRDTAPNKEVERMIQDLLKRARNLS
jgi:Phage Mu protein F like protein